MSKKTQETKRKILESFEDKKVVKMKPSFKAKWEIFVIRWRVTRKFPDYSLLKEIKEIFKSQEYEVILK